MSAHQRLLVLKSRLDQIAQELSLHAGVSPMDKNAILKLYLDAASNALLIYPHPDSELYRVFHGRVVLTSQLDEDEYILSRTLFLPNMTSYTFDDICIMIGKPDVQDLYLLLQNKLQECRPEFIHHMG